MKNTYTVNLNNHDGCDFDNGSFTSICAARKWAAGRGQTYSFGRWYGYSVTITRNGKIIAEYTTR